MIGATAGVLAAAGVAAYGAFHRNSPVFGRVLGRLDTKDRTVALTFDDGPNEVATPRILETLARYKVRATFFVLGRHAELWPDLVRRVVDEGHQIGNHGYYHRRLHTKSPAFVRRDIMFGSAAIQRACDRRPEFFRSPHGFRSPWTTWLAHSLGQRTVGWTLGVWDSEKPGANEIVRRVLEEVKPGAIILLHDGDGYDPAGDRSQTVDALPLIIEELRARRYTFSVLPTT